MRLSGILAITNSKGKSASSWKMILWTFIASKVYLTLLIPVFHGFRDEFYDFFGYFVYFQTIDFPGLRDHIIGVFVIDPQYRYIFPHIFTLLLGMLINVE